MKYKRIITCAAIASVVLFSNSCSERGDSGPGLDDLTYGIPVQGNSWVVNDFSINGDIISSEGIRNWSDTSTVIRTYFRTDKPGRLAVGIRCAPRESESKVQFKVNDTSRKIRIKGVETDTLFIGYFDINKPGYNYIEMQGISREGSVFADINDIIIGGEATGGELHYVKDDFYWGRRGPSVHLRYDIPEGTGDIRYFYNEITVPEGNDVPGSYFMACGFGEGYFGIQVNSETERRILFSVWSPYSTDNPADIPEDQRIILLDKGADVVTGSFGNEGSGGQSYMRYYWKAGTTYRFLLKGEPSVNNSTDYSAYFFAPETGKWQLIASFRRPKTNTYLTRLYSFLENFLTETGPVSRMGLYGNQWVYDTGGSWREITGATFTADATARKDARLDYAGGSENGNFYLMNCGFFSERTPVNSHFTRTGTGREPETGQK